MRTTILTFLLLRACFGLQGQNLVANYSFETYSTCPTTAGQITNATGWDYSRNAGEYLNSCSASTFADVPTNYFGFQEAATGQAYAGGIMYGSFASSYIADLREFFYVPLSTPLTIGATYYVSFKVSLADNAEYAINNLGAQFVTSYNSNFPINNMAHVYTTSVVSDKTDWVEISGSFVPTVAYNAVLFGNFFTDANITVDFVGSSVDIGYNAYYFFDDVYVSTTPLALAIELAALSAKNAGPQNILNWKTVSEDAGDYFEVERSTDAHRFSKIATVAGKYQTGGSYQLTDEYPAPGINYYRLKMMSPDGKYSYSKIVNTRAKEGIFVLEAYPNPVGDLLTLRVGRAAQGTAMLTIMDAAGKIVRSLPLNGSTASIDMQGLAAGYYMLHYQDDAISENTKIIKR